MDAVEITSPPAGARNNSQNKLKWQDSLPVQRLLDVVSAVLAEEYISAAKQNPEVFNKQGEGK
jgi:hypothetical protein